MAMEQLRRALLVAAMTALLAGCGGDEAPQAARRPTGQTLPTGGDSSAATNSAPEIVSLMIRPAQPRPGDSLVAEARATDDDGDALTLEYQWSIDGRVQDESGQTLHPHQLETGAVIEVVVRARDGFEQSAPAQASVRIGNQPPMMLGVTFQPNGEIRGDRDISARPHATDPDGDSISYSYRWWVNDEPVGEDDPVLPAGEFGRGDSITLAVVASDGLNESEELRTDPIEVQNAPPHVVSSPGGFGSDGVFRYRIEVEDADGDSRFTYRLVQGPEGMAIDSLDGQMVWRPRESQAGTHDVAFEVNDRHGGKTTQSFKLQLAFEETAVPAAGSW
jgi:hypothetical protein